MAGIGLLVPDLLSEIMFRLPSSIEQKFDFAQVSRLWRDVALDSHLFWSSFAGGHSKADSSRLPLMLERSGSKTMLHIQFWVPNWDADALKALVPYVARIGTLDLDFREAVDVEALLNSNLEFPTLRTLRLVGPAFTTALPLSLSAPQLRTLDIERFSLKNWATLLSPNLENIRLCNSTAEMFVGILKRCPQAWRIELQSWDPWYRNNTEDPFAVFSSRPLAPALRELELKLADADLARVLQTGFSDAVLHSLTGRICNGHGEDDVELLAGALLPGVGPLTSFKLIDMRDLELHDETGRIRRLQCWNDDSSFQARDVWKHLSLHYGLHKTVRELRIHAEHWHEYLEIFEFYPPQLQDGITVAIETGWGEFPQVQDDEGDFMPASKILRMPGLAKVKFCGSQNSDYFLQTISDVLALIEPPRIRKVEVCVELTAGAQNVLVTLQSTLPGNSWAICSHCVPCVQ